MNHRSINSTRTLRFFVVLFSLFAVIAVARSQNSWELVSLNTVEGAYSDLTDVSFWSAGGGVVVGSYGYTFYTVDSGKTWTQKAAPAVFNTIYHFDVLHGIATRSIQGSPAKDYYASVWNTSDGGTSWNLLLKDSYYYTTFRGIGFWDTLQGCIISDYYHVLGNYGIVPRYTSDGGVSWSPAAYDSGILQAYPRLSSLSIVDAHTGYALLGYSEVLTGNRYSRLLRATDAGHSWIARGSVKFSATAIANFVNQQIGTIIENGNRILRSEDGGLNWLEQKNPVSTLLFSVCFGTPAAGVAVGEDGVIISTMDGGAHWKVEPTLTSEPLSKVYVSSVGNVIAIGSSGTIIRGHIQAAPWIPPNAAFPILAQNFPNPFNSATRIPFALDQSGYVSLKVFDLLGREVAAVVNEELDPGNYERPFDGMNLPSGVYLVRLQSGGRIATGKIVRVK
jgi:photosystem II stability/assembly factor-like uncharacterized protein